MATDVRDSPSLPQKTIKTVLISGFLLWSLGTADILMAAKQYPELDYENNTGFKQEVPEELRRELPMCDEFLDVHWIREMPDRKNWVGRVVVDIKKDGKKEQRELAIVEKRFGKRRQGLFRIFDITETKYRGSLFDKLVLSADHVANLYNPIEGDHTLAWGLSVIHNGQEIVLKGSVLSIQTRRDGGL